MGLCRYSWGVAGYGVWDMGIYSHVTVCHMRVGSSKIAKRSVARYGYDKLCVRPSVTLVDCDNTRWNFQPPEITYFTLVMSDSAKKKTIRFESVPQTSRFDSIRFNSIHCSVRISLDNPHQGFWTLV